MSRKSVVSESRYSVDWHPAKNVEQDGESDGVFRDEDSFKDQSSIQASSKNLATEASSGSPCRVSSREAVLPERNHDFLLTVAGVAGNVLEWYDFAIFGFFSETIGEVFFPPGSGHSQTEKSFLVFGMAFIMRPLGGALLGYIGDMYGRKKALVFSIFLMAIPTFAMGCLPSYERSGNMAIALLILTRMLQGLSVGGQLMSSLVFTLERHDPAHWGLYGSFVMAAANFGTLLGNIVAFVLQSSLTDDQLKAYGWRIPFWSGILVSLSGFYLRFAGGEDHAGQGHSDPCATDSDRTSHSDLPKNNADESFDDVGEPDAQVDVPGESSSDLVHTAAMPTSNPLLIAFAKKNRRALASAAMVPTLWSGGFYLTFVWMTNYMKNLSNHPVENSFGVNAFSLLLSVCFFFPVAGILSDRYGRVRIMGIGAVGMGILSPALVWLIGRGHSWLAFAAQVVMGTNLSFWGAPMCAWLVESFDPEARLTSVAIGYNIAQATVGGMSPAIATILVDNVSVNAPGWMLTALAVIALTGLCLVAPPKNNRSALVSNRRFAPVPTAHNLEVDTVGHKGSVELDDDDHKIL